MAIEARASADKFERLEDVLRGEENGFFAAVVFLLGEL